MIEEAKITSKGQVTIPKEVRESLGLHTGTRIIFIVENGEAIMMPKVKDPFNELEKMREEISFTPKEVEDLIKESKQSWSKF